MASLVLSFLIILFGCFCSSAALLVNTSIPLNIASGPESLAFDCKGQGPYVGVSDGRVLRWEGAEWKQFSVPTNHRSDSCDGTNDPLSEPDCGRPLGLGFNSKTCELYIADSTFGLLKVGPNGGDATQLAAGIDGIPFLFANGLDIDQSTGIIYFTDSSTRFHRSAYAAIIFNGDRTGRLLKYDPSTKTVTVLLGNLAFPNGVAVSHDGTFVLVTETSTGGVQRYWLKGPKASTSEVFIQLPGQPDNIKRNAKGEFWAAVNPFEVIPPVVPYIINSQAMKLNENGMVTEVFAGNDGSTLEAISEAQEKDGNLWIGSIVSSSVSVFKI
ncbi:protein STRICTOSIDINE SYNTHASE-LIKE 10-like [Macadamia integrifolia]|uniref:protein STRICTOSIDINE SYNTHASE-LIKE 10-like n=1 Tax=Macadamia integrifolia TaxID=60698 RepID=UPI001C4E57EA|nr:protein STRICTOSIDINE SYNTHASE-LIKE 10-like [Macadamia integrifolia]